MVDFSDTGFIDISGAAEIHAVGPGAVFGALVFQLVGATVDVIGLRRAHVSHGDVQAVLLSEDMSDELAEKLLRVLGLSQVPECVLEGRGSQKEVLRVDHRDGRLTVSVVSSRRRSGLISPSSALMAASRATWARLPF